MSVSRTSKLRPLRLTTEDIANRLYNFVFGRAVLEPRVDDIADVALAFIERSGLKNEFREFALDELQSRGKQIEEERAARYGGRVVR